MTPVLLDTHVLLWMLSRNRRMGDTARARVDRALEDDVLLVSAITFWEVALLRSKGRMEFDSPIGPWRRSVLDLGVREVPLDGETGVAAVELEGLHADPADRIVCASALTHGAVLVTADERLLAWEGALPRLDARK